MDDYQFELLRIKAAVCPSKDRWPSPDVKVSIMGDKPTISGGCCTGAPSTQRLTTPAIAS